MTEKKRSLLLTLSDRSDLHSEAKAAIRIALAERDELLKACRTAILIFEICPPDFSNGVLGPDNRTDEGEVRGWALVAEIREAIVRATNSAGIVPGSVPEVKTDC